METKARNADEQKVFDLLAKIDQTHLYANIDQYTPEQRDAFVKQVNSFFPFQISTSLLLLKSLSLPLHRSSTSKLSTPVVWLTITRTLCNALLMPQPESILTKVTTPRSLPVKIFTLYLSDF